MHEVNFERDRFEGQMNVEERELLYNTVMSEKPQICVETGTCRGGGTTYYIASALANLKASGDETQRMLHSIEMLDEFYNYAIALYHNTLNYLNEFVYFHHGNSLNILRTLGMYLPKVDLLMIDGGADSMASLYDFTTIKHLIPIGGHVICHDWDQSKCTYLKPVLVNDHDYQLVGRQIDLVVFKKTGEFHKCS